METTKIAREVLDTMLGYLGFVAEVETDTSRDETSLQVLTGEPELLIGDRGERPGDRGCPVWYRAFQRIGR